MPVPPPGVATVTVSPIRKIMPSSLWALMLRRGAHLPKLIQPVQFPPAYTRQRTSTMVLWGALAFQLTFRLQKGGIANSGVV